MSELGLGGVLYQADDQGVLKVVAYASRSLSQMERNYPAHKLEFLALKWAVADHFHEYLYGGRFDVYMDNNPLTYILTSAKLDVCGQRWVTSLANYDFRLFYKMGKTNIEVDALSRIWREEYYELERPIIKALLKASQEMDWTDFNRNLSEIDCKSSQLVTEKMTTEQWKKEQAEDEAISEVIKAITSGDVKNFASEQAKQMYRSWSKLTMRHGLLYRKYYDINLKEERMQFVLPKRYWHKVLEDCHDNVGHLGIERTISLLHDRFYWQNMEQDIEIYVKSYP